MMSKERYKLHPISAVVNFIKGLKDLIFPFVLCLLQMDFKEVPREMDIGQILFLIL